jgi:hypothetical protein
MNSNAAANAMNALNTITGVGERFGFDPVGMMFRNRYSLRNRSAGAISFPSMAVFY